MLSNLTTSAKVFLVTSLICLVNVAIFIYQVLNLKISPWNVIPTILVGMIVIGNIKTMVQNKPLDKDTTNKTKKHNIKNADDNEDFYAINTSFPSKLTTNNIIVKLVFIGIFVALALLFNTLGSTNQYDLVVKGLIKETYVGGDVYTEIYDGEATTTDTRYLILVVDYEHDGHVYEIEVEDHFSHSRDSDIIELCIKDNGKFVCVYDNIVTFQIMYYACIILTILTALGFMFRLPNVYLVMLVLIFVGLGVICMFNSFYWAGWLLKDFTLFGGCFFILGVMCYIQMILLRIIHSLHSGNPNFTLE